MLAPCSRFDADLIEALPYDEDIYVHIDRRRSVARLHAYWLGVTRLVEATECAATVQACHRDIKEALGMFTTRTNGITNEETREFDSIAFDKMSEDEMRQFFAAAEKIVLERFGFNPWGDETPTPQV